MLAEPSPPDRYLEHIRSSWPSERLESRRFERGPLHAVLPDIVFVSIAPQNPFADPWVNATCGLQEAGAPSTEVFLLSAEDDSDNATEILAMVAYFHADPRYRLHVGEVIDIGRPWQPDSALDHLLVSLPYPYGPKLEWMGPEGSSTRFLWLLPISRAEAERVRSEGLEAFEQSMDDAGVDTIDPFRSQVL